jgi:hypothetical protein
MVRLLMVLLVVSLLVSCVPQSIPLPASVTQFPERITPARPPDSISKGGLTTTPKPLVPAFEHIVIIVFENEGFTNVISFCTY